VPFSACSWKRTKIKSDLNVTEDDLLHAREESKNFTLEETRQVCAPGINILIPSVVLTTSFQMMMKVLKVHETDPNFPVLILQKIQDFLNNEDIFNHPENHSEIISEMKVEAALIMGNSPYAEVRAVVNNTDDVNMPCSTIRAWVCEFSFFFSFYSILREWDLYLNSSYMTDTRNTGDRSFIRHRPGFRKSTILYSTASNHAPSQCSTTAMLSCGKSLGSCDA
jgi:hypothetical protein